MSQTGASGPIRVLMVDDHPMLREGVASVIRLQPGIALVGEAENGQEAVARFRELRPDVTLMDLQMPLMNGLEAIKVIRDEAPAARIIVLTTYSGQAQAISALKAGAVGYLLKSALRKEMIDAIQAVHEGRRYVPADIAREIADHIFDTGLSGRETEILRLIAAGQSNKEIGRELSIAEGTVKAHLKSIFAKLEVTDRTQAVIRAVKRGIIDL